VDGIKKNIIMITIKILGTGCPNCQRLEINVRQAVAESNIDAKIEKITDLTQIAQTGAMSMPAMVVNEKLVLSGRIPDVAELKKILTDD